MLHPLGGFGGVRRRLKRALLQAPLKLYDAPLQILDPTALPVQGLEQAVECLPDCVAHLCVSPLQISSSRLFAELLCFIRETVYHGFHFVASIKQGLA
jgi:hypothetical protein